MFLLGGLLAMALPARAAYLLIPMDQTQTNHLKAYGVAYFVLQREVEISWLLNYKGGSYLIPYHDMFERECKMRNVSYQVIADAQASAILAQIADPGVNMDEMKLQKVPRVAVYAPKNSLPWDDAVTLVLTYAEIPYDVVYDDEVLQGLLPSYDWLHLHHEDFTGQYGKFWARYHNYPWYQEDVRLQEATAARWGFSKVSQLKLAVAKKIREFVAGGGYMFAMCSAPDSFDIALAAEGLDICDYMFDGDPIRPGDPQRLNYDNCFAFTDFSVSTNPQEYEVSNIDVPTTRMRTVNESNDYFLLFDFSANGIPCPPCSSSATKSSSKALWDRLPPSVSLSSNPAWWCSATTPPSMRTAISTAISVTVFGLFSAATIPRTTAISWATRRPNSTCTPTRPVID